LINGRPVVAVVGDVGLDVRVVPTTAVAFGSDTRAEVRMTLGGAGANTATWLATCGAKAVVIGRVGADGAAALARAHLERSGVRTFLAVDEALPTCCVVVLVDAGGRRTMFPSRGASAALRPDDLIGVDLANVDHLHLSGYVLLDPSSRPAGLAAIARARATGITTSVDPQAAALVADPDQFMADVTGVDLLLPNEDELIALTGRPGLDAAAGLLDLVGAVAVTAGERGAAWVDRERSVVLPADPAEVVDPTGAGDAFDAGLLAAWIRGDPPEMALRAGNLAGRRAIMARGARPL
jgi:sugar/nucleoside kinase (ribokinase family)